MLPDAFDVLDQAQILVAYAVGGALAWMIGMFVGRRLLTMIKKTIIRATGIDSSDVTVTADKYDG